MTILSKCKLFYLLIFIFASTTFADQNIEQEIPVRATLVRYLSPFSRPIDFQETFNLLPYETKNFKVTYKGFGVYKDLSLKISIERIVETPLQLSDESLRLFVTRRYYRKDIELTDLFHSWTIDLPQNQTKTLIYKYSSIDRKLGLRLTLSRDL